MTQIKTTRGRPKLAPEENETRERILNTAEKLFAQKGFDKVTLRELTTAANTNLAAVNYYFGTKDNLLSALVLKGSKCIYKERMRLLAEAKIFEGSTRDKARKIVNALLLPAIIVAEDSQTNYLFSTLVAKSIANSPEELTDIMVRQTSHLNPFVDALHQLLPEIPLEEIYWRLHFILNIEHAVHTELDRINYISNGVCSTKDKQALLDRILDFVLPGLVAQQSINTSTKAFTA